VKPSQCDDSAKKKQLSLNTGQIAVSPLLTGNSRRHFDAAFRLSIRQVVEPVG
jgi:hypothetical protein